MKRPLGYHAAMTRTVGHCDRTEFVLDPADALRQGQAEGVEIRTLDIEGLRKTKTDYRDKDRIDREALERLRKRL